MKSIVDVIALERELEQLLDRMNSVQKRLNDINAILSTINGIEKAISRKQNEVRDLTAP